MNTERIKELMTKKRLSKSERDEVQAACNEAGITITNTGCPNCWHDALVQLYKGSDVPRGAIEKTCIDGWRVRDAFAGGFIVNYQRMDAHNFNPSYLLAVGAGQLLERCK